jgi:hypothetical protein
MKEEKAMSEKLDELHKLYDEAYHRLGNAEREASRIRVELNVIGNEIGKEVCPFKRGQIVTCTVEMGFRGKKVKKRARITQISGYRRPDSNRDYSVVKGIYLRKDGCDGMLIDLYEYEHWMVEGGA